MAQEESTILVKSNRL